MIPIIHLSTCRSIRFLIFLCFFIWIVFFGWRRFLSVFYYSSKFIHDLFCTIHVLLEDILSLDIILYLLRKDRFKQIHLSSDVQIIFFILDSESLRIFYNFSYFQNISIYLYFEYLLKWEYPLSNFFLFNSPMEYLSQN